MTLEQMKAKAYVRRTNWLSEIKQLADKRELTPSALTNSLDTHGVGHQLSTILVQKNILKKDDGVYIWNSHLTMHEVNSNLFIWVSEYMREKQLNRRREQEVKEERLREKRRNYYQKWKAKKNGQSIPETKKQVKVTDLDKKHKEIHSKVFHHNGALTTEKIYDILELTKIAEKYKVPDRVEFVKIMIENKEKSI